MISTDWKVDVADSNLISSVNRKFSNFTLLLSSGTGFETFFYWARFENLLRNPKNFYDFSITLKSIMEPYKFYGFFNKVSKPSQSKNA